MKRKSISTHSVFLCIIIMIVISFQFSFDINAQNVTRAEIREYHGTPTVFINGEPNALFCNQGGGPDYIAKVKEIGLNFATTHYQMEGTWIGPDEYDYSQVDQFFTKRFEANPELKFLPRITLDPPESWISQYPEEMMVFDDGSTIPWPLRNSTDKKHVPSFSSMKWREATAEYLRNLIEHIRSQPYGKNMIGYHLVAGSSNEWLYWNFEHGPVGDFSKPQLREYRKWLKNKYKTKDELKKAWNNPKASFEKAAIPTEAERDKGDYFMFRDPLKSQNVIDYMEFHSWVVQDAINYFAKTVKETSNYENLVGAFYGYLLHVRGQYQRVSDSYQEQGHFDLAELLESPYIDFIGTQTQYEFREVGTGYSVFMSLPQSVQLHGKLFIDKNEYRTHLVPWHYGYGRTSDFKESEANQLRQLSNELTHASGVFLNTPWFNSEPMQKLLEKLNAIAQKSIEFERTSNAEIAVVIDEYSMYMMRRDKRLSLPLIYYQMLSLGKIGAPFDYILQDDLNRARPYKMYIFLNAFHISDKQKEMIQKLPDRGVKAILWVYAPGYAGKTLDSQNCCDLTGLKISCREAEGQLQVKINQNGARFLPGVKEGAMYGQDRGGSRNLIGPLFYGDDPSADVLGLLYGHDLPGLITKEINGVQVYYSAAPQISAAVFRGIAARAGVHIYNFRDDVLYANSSFIALHTAEKGERIIKFPKRVNLYDVYHEKEIANNVSEVKIDLPARETFLYFKGIKEEWESK